MNPCHHISTPASPPKMEPSHPSPVDSSPTMESSKPSPADSMHPPPTMNEQIRPSKSLKSSESMNPGGQGSTPSSPTVKPSQPSLTDSLHPSSPMDAIASIREILKNIDPAEHIDSFFRFLESHLRKMNALPEAGSSSSEDRLDTVGDGIKFAAKAIDTISTEAERLSDLNEVVKAVESVTLNVMKGMADLYWVFIGLSVATYTVQKYLTVGYTDKEWREAVVNIVELAKTVKEYNQRMPDEREQLCNAVAIIAEGAVIFCDNLNRGKLSRCWSSSTVAAKLENTNEEVRDSITISRLQQHWDRDVFLSHSGKQKNFVRQLHKDLTGKHVSCFFDEDRNSLPLGERFPSLMFKAAEKCRIAVLVLSEEFLCSKWPMLELSAFVKAIKSGKNPNLKLLPIFFLIKPGKLSRITEDTPEWKEWQKFELGNDTYGEWQEALKYVRSINGLEFRENGNEVHIREEAVKDICYHLKGINPPRLLEVKPVGIENQVRKVKALLDMKGPQSALAVIVCGLGGMGKSTLASSVIESLDWSSTEFRFCRVAVNNKSPDKTSHIKDLQKDILSYLGEVNVDLRDTLDGRLKIKEALENKFSLLFIDNVVDKHDIRELLPGKLSYSGQNTKLRIIITSRDKDVKAQVQIMWKEYEVKALSEASSKRLLSETIEQSQNAENIGPGEEEERLINEVSSACKGVPLLLSVFGRYLGVERDKQNYQQVLSVLRKGNLDSYREEDLGSTLMYVYNKIKDVEVQEAFLDICAYFHGWEWNLVADIVDTGELNVLEDLHRKMLVSKGGSGEVIVHDIWLLMGLKEAGHTRFSEWKKFSDALEYELYDLEKVKGLSLVPDNHLITFPTKTLEAMHRSLRVLMLGGWVTLEGHVCQKAFPNLRYLSVGDITTFPFKSKLNKLRVFVNKSKPGMNFCQLPSSLKHICHEVPYVECDEFPKKSLENLSSLKSLVVKTEISWKSLKLPNALHLPASLVDLDLSGCKNLPKDISHLTALESLILDGCDLKCLPQGLDKLTKLKNLSIDTCFNLQVLPESFGKLPISSLQLNELNSLNKLPNSFGDMRFLKDLILRSCSSLMSLPDSFVQLKMLETLEIEECDKLSILPKDFGQLRCLKHMAVRDCELFKELPCGFGALPALKTFELESCDSFENLPRDFGDLTSLEQLHLEELPLKSIPYGFGKLNRLRLLVLNCCPRLKTLSDDFENMATLERLKMACCGELEGTMMEKIIKLQNCLVADIAGSEKLVEKWKEMRSRIEHPFEVVSGDSQADRETEKRAIMGALLNGKCVEVNKSSGELLERSSLLAGLEEQGASATVALVILHHLMPPIEETFIQRFTKMATETAETNGWGILHIVCIRRFEMLSSNWITRTEEDESAENQNIRQILMSMPNGSFALSERVKLKLPEGMFFIGHVVVGTEGSKSFQDFREVGWSEISKPVILEKEEMDEEEVEETDEEEVEETEAEKEEAEEKKNTIAELLNSVFDSREVVTGQSKTREFIEGLKGNGIDHLLVKGQKVMVDDLHGKTIGLICCNLIEMEWIKLLQLYKDLQQNSDFILISIPNYGIEAVGHGSCSRVSQCMPWATIPHPEAVGSLSSFVVLDNEGQIDYEDAFRFLLGWGLKFYPFTQHSICESFSRMESESPLKILLHGMNIAGRNPMESKMTFLYSANLTEWREMKRKLEEFTQIDGGFEILYVGVYDIPSNIEQLKQEYADATQEMNWPSLSISDSFTFWNRCHCSDCSNMFWETNIMEAVCEFARDIHFGTPLVLVEKDGVVTGFGEDVVEMICDISNGKGMDESSLFPFVKTWFGDEIDDHPLHRQHHLSRMTSRKYYMGNLITTGEYYTCRVCFCKKLFEWNSDEEPRSYECGVCGWQICGSCWMAYAKHAAQQLVPAKDH